MSYGYAVFGIPEMMAWDIINLKWGKTLMPVKGRFNIEVIRRVDRDVSGDETKTFLYYFYNMVTKCKFRLSALLKHKESFDRPNFVCVNHSLTAG